MSVERYLAELTSKPNPAEPELYGTLDTEIMRGVLGYPVGRVRINRRQKELIPDLTLISDQDEQWVVCEVKVDDDEIRVPARRKKLWDDQAKDYIEPDTMYVCLIGRHTIYVCDLHGEIVQGVHIETNKLTDERGQNAKVLSDVTLRQMLSLITYEEACGQRKYEAFRRGTAISAKLPIEEKNMARFQATIYYAVEQLEPVLRNAWDDVQAAYLKHRERAEPIEAVLNAIGSDPKARKQATNRLHTITLPVRDIVHIVEDDYPAFKHSQEYAGTQQEEQFLKIFITDTAYIIMSRLLFVRICEDLGMVSPKVSHRGVAIWQEFFDNAPAAYRDLISAAFSATKHVYSGLFERSVFDWWACTNGQLSAVLERILYRLNAFEFGALTADVLGDLYQSFLPPAKRKQLGEFYTDVEVVDYILKRTGILDDSEIAQKRVLDPACGSFTFGIRLAQHLLKGGSEAGLGAADRIERVANVLVGFDVNPFAVFISQMNLIFAILPLYQEAKQTDADYVLPNFQVHWLNSLVGNEQASSSEVDTAPVQPFCLSEKYDYVVGNPPYVRNERVPEVDRESIETAFSQIKHKNTDLSAYFVYRAMKQWLKPEGKLGFVVSLGLANSDSTSLMRDSLREFTLLEVSSLEWVATELFKGTDIVPMLIFAQPSRPDRDHEIELLQNLRSVKALPAATSRTITDDGAFVTKVKQDDWLRASTMGHWCLEVTPQDLPLLERLQSCRTLQNSSAGKAKFGIKAGKTGSAHIRDLGADIDSEIMIPYCKGEAIATWGHSSANQVLPLSKLCEMSDPSAWKALVDVPLQSALAYDGNEMPNGAVFIANIHPTLCACVANPREVALNNSAMVVVPSGLSAHALCAIINSRPSRYIAFLAFRSAVLLRRRATWTPRIVDNLPAPTLDESERDRLEELSRLAHELSTDIDTSELDLWADRRGSYTDTIRAVQLLNWTGWTEGTLTEAALQKATIDGGELRLAPLITVSGDHATLMLLLWTLQMSATADTTRDQAMNAQLPRDPHTRQQIVDEITTSRAGRDNCLRQLHESIEPEIDEIVIAGLGLSKDERNILVTRCQEFPLSETIGRPRYLWSEDRRKQALRRYTDGGRYGQS